MERGPRQVGICKKHKVVSKVTIEESGADVTWVPPPTPKAI